MIPEPYSIGADSWNGLSKLVEECGEVQQVIGKIQGTDGKEIHWDGSNLRDRLTEEVADVIAAGLFVASKNNLNVSDRILMKLAKFGTWNSERKEEARSKV